MFAVRLLRGVSCVVTASIFLITSNQANAAIFSLDHLNSTDQVVQTLDGRVVYSNFDITVTEGSEISDDLNDYRIMENVDRFSLLMGANTTAVGTLILEFDMAMADGIDELVTSTNLLLSKNMYTGGMAMRITTHMFDSEGNRINDGDGNASQNLVEYSADQQVYKEHELLDKGYDSIHIKMYVELVPASIGFNPAPEPGVLSLLALGGLAMITKRRRRA